MCLALAEALARFGVPEEIITDNGKQFTDRFGRHGARNGEVLFDKICRKNGITHRLTAPASPNQNGKVERFQCATRRAVVSPAQPGGTRREVPGSDGLPGCRKVKGTRACQLTRGRVQVSGTVLWGTRVIWRKLDCLNPNLQEMEVHIRRKDA